MKKLINLIILTLYAYSKSFSQAAFIDVSKDTDCNILKVSIDGSRSTGKAPLNYYWNFGNGNATSGTDKAVVNAIYVQPGQPVVSLYVVDADGKKSDVVTKTLNILSGPKIDFDVNTVETCLGQTVQFINRTVPGSSPISGYIWNIGNNVTLNEKEPGYTFTATGVYDVTLIVTDANGCNVNLKKERLISVSNSFKADFKADSVTGCKLPFNTKFSDLTEYGELSPHNFSYKWNFGDGSSSAEKNPEKAYTNSGIYDVQLLITDLNTKCISEKKQPAFITLDVRKPVLSIDFVSKKCSEYLYKIKPNISNLPADIIKTINFGDGTTITIKNETEILHTYTKAGKYKLVTNYTNPKNTKCNQASIDSIIIPDTGEEILASNQAGCNLPFNTQFSVKNISDAASFNWDFGDGTTSTDASPAKNYLNNGSFSVRLKVTSTSGCSYDLEKKNFIQIGPLRSSFTSDAARIETLPNEYNINPIANPSVLNGGCAPFSVNFKNTSSSGTGLIYTWNYGDGSKIISHSPELKHTYLSEGIFFSISHCI